MTDKATPTLRQRCDTALQSLPDAPYKTMLAVLFDDMTAEVERLAAQSAPSEPTVSLAKSRIGRVYLAGPMTGYENFNFPAFNAAAQRLRAEGFDVVNPADHGIVDGAEWADYLRFDLGKLAQCESIALLPGWEVSKGANLEVSVAQKLGMVVRCLDGAAQPSQAPVVQAVQDGPERDMITQQQALEALERVYYATHASFIDRNLVRQYIIEQSTAQPQAVVPADQRPVNCGTGYCSCIECVVEPTAQAERAPVVQAVQAREYPPLPWGNQQPYVWFCRTKDTDLIAAFRAYVDADRASSGATTQAVRMLTEDEQAAIIDMHSTGRAQGDHECAEAIQRKFCEVNKLPAPADGVIGGA